MSGAVVGDPSITTEKLQSLPPRSEHTLEGGSGDLPAHSNEPQAQASMRSNSPKTALAKSQIAPVEIRLLNTEPSPQISNNRWKPRQIRQWKSPLAMLTFCVIGLGMSTGHCVFYPKLNGVMVGNSNNQERNIRQAPPLSPTSLLLQRTELPPFRIANASMLRFGTAFAFLSQIALTASVWLSYTQWLWRSVKTVEMSVKGLNAAFGADTSVFSLLNVEMLRKFKIGSVMALFAWCLMLPPFFTPATLFIYPSTNMVEVEQSVPYLAIADSNSSHKFAYSPPYNNETKSADDGSRTFNGPRTILTLISTATASLGQILPINAPYNHSTYSVRFFGPVVRCDMANSSAAARMDNLLQAKMATSPGIAKETVNVYYAFVPAFNTTGELIALSKPRLQSPSNATNQLWMTFLRYAIDPGGNRIKERRYQVCQLYNASYDLKLEWDRGFQNATGSYGVLEEVRFPNDKSDVVSDLPQHSYSAFMWALTDLLVGAFSWFVESNQSQFGAIDTTVPRTSLLGSSDLDVFFDLNKNNEDSDETQLSDQRLQDKALAKNRTLGVLIEELSFNMTVSLMHNELLNHNTTAKVTRWDSVNRYGYNPYGLFIPYALANLFTLITVLLGIVSYSHNGVLPDKKFQDIVSAAEDPRIIHVARDRRKSMTAERVEGRLVLRPGMDR